MYPASRRDRVKLRRIYELCSRLKSYLVAIEKRSYNHDMFLEYLTESISRLKEFLPDDLPEQSASDDVIRDMVELYDKIERFHTTFRADLSVYHLNRRLLKDSLHGIQSYIFAYFLP